MSCGKDENKLYEAGIGSFKKVAMTEQSITTPDDPGLNPALSNFRFKEDLFSANG